MPERAAKIHYEFNDFRLDPQQRLLLTRAEGRPIPLSPKVFETLLYFVERRGELLDKATLMKAIWPNIVVEENSLNQNISALRRALGESPGEHRFIVTEPGRGYRFVADVRTLTASAAAEEFAVATGARTAAAQAPVARASSRSSIAVLPFANLTREPEKEYFSDGMAEELIHLLARVPGLKVPARTSVFAYKGKNVDIRQIARDLQVDVVLEGSVRSAGERIRVTAQLIDGETGYHLWSQNYDRQFEDLFKLQDELASAIVQTLRVTLDGSTPATVAHEPPTRDLEAYQLYLQAMSLQVTGEVQTMTRVAEMLRRAIARDPGFARAYNALASVRAVAAVLDLPLAGTLADAELEVTRALALDPSLGASHGALGTIYATQGKWLEAEDRYQQSFACDSSDPIARQAYGLYVLASAGFSERSLNLELEAHRLAPAWVVNLMTVGAGYAILGNYAEAARFLEMGVQAGMNRHGTPASDIFANIALNAGRHEEAAQSIIDSLPPPMRSPDTEQVVRTVFAAFANARSRATAVEALDRLRARAGRNIPFLQFARRRFMLWYTMLGAFDQAFAAAKESLDDFATHGSIGAAWGFMWMPEMLPFRHDPRFQAFAARMKLFDYWNKFGPPDNCELRDGKLLCR
jgi:TolB-like protein